MQISVHLFPQNQHQSFEDNLAMHSQHRKKFRRNGSHDVVAWFRFCAILSNVPGGKMLGMAWPTQKSAGMYSRLESQKTHLKSICLQYHMYLLLNSHFFFLLKNKTGLTIFFLCAYIPNTEGDHCKWTEVLKDLEQIKTSKKECQEPIMRCFFLEMNVILHECNIKNCSKTQDVYNILKNGNASFKNELSSTTSKKCKECEEYEEKSFTEFIQNFVKVIQKECK
uniref:Interleukin n=1 Tax=Anas platyrhynchos platyrhynchos TaxID=8840 RepID=U3IAY2_ANAPP